MIASRVLAVLAAILLVSSVFLATVGEGTMSLGQALFLLNQNMITDLTSWSSRFLGAWFWTLIMQPLLIRPVWLLPASAGIVCCGMSVTLANRNSIHRSHRRS